jgi:hypothetical protein
MVRIMVKVINLLNKKGKIRRQVTFNINGKKVTFRMKFR